MNTIQRANHVREIIAEEAVIDISLIHGDMTLGELDLDSMERIELEIALEDSFDIEFDTDGFKPSMTVGELTLQVAKLMGDA